MLLQNCYLSQCIIATCDYKTTVGDKVIEVGLSHHNLHSCLTFSHFDKDFLRKFAPTLSVTE